MKLHCYDNGGKTIDRYTVVFQSKEDKTGHNTYNALSMSSQPFHPQGDGMHAEAALGKHLGKRVSWYSLPMDVKKCVVQDLLFELNNNETR